MRPRLASFAGLLLGACLGVDAPERTRWVVDVRRPEIARPRGDFVLQVRPFRAAAGCAGRQIVFLGDGEEQARAVLDLTVTFVRRDDGELLLRRALSRRVPIDAAAAAALVAGWREAVRDSFTELEKAIAGALASSF